MVRSLFTWKRLASLSAAVTLVMGATFAGADGVVGEWDLTWDMTEMIGREISMKLTISGTEGALTGKLSSQRGDSDLEDVKFENGTLTFVRNFDYQGQAMSMTYSGKLDGDALAGSFSSDFGDSPANAVRVGGAAEPAAAASGGILGDWDLELDIGGQMMPLTLSLSESDGELQGRISSDQGDVELTEEKYENGELTFKLNVEEMGMEFDFKGSLEGEKMVATFSSDMGEMPLSGFRAGAAGGDEAAPASSIVGEWKIVSESALGTLERKLIINEDLSGKYITDTAEADVKDLTVDGNNISFNLTLDIQGSDLNLSFKGTLDGGSLSGEFETEAGNATVTGERIGGGAETVEALTGSVDLPGLWNAVAESPEAGASDVTITFAQTDTGFSAHMETALGPADFPEVNLDGNSLSFSAEVDFGGVMVPMSFKGSVGGDQLQGSATLNMQGQEMVFTLTGSKGKQGLTGEVILAGTWTLEVSTPDGAASTSMMYVSEDGDSYQADLRTELGNGIIKSVQVDGNRISFDTEIDFGGVMVPLSFEGTTGDGNLEGTLTADFDGQKMELPLTGTRTGDDTTAPEPAATDSANTDDDTTAPEPSSTDSAESTGSTN